MRKYIVFIFILASAHIYSQENAADTTRLSERIQTIQKMLDESKKNIDLWNYGWLGGYSAATAAQGVVCLTSKDLKTRQDMALGAGTTLLGALFQGVNPLNSRKYADKLAQMPEITEEDRITKLMYAEEYLENISGKEREGRTWKIHALNTAVNLGSGLITWLGYKRSVWDGAANFLLNSAITEFQIWSQPMKTTKDYKNYCRKYKNGENVELQKKYQTEIIMGANSSGVSLIVRF